MTPVALTIAALLYDHKTVIVPGLGAFLCHAEGAKVNVITNQFEKPSCTLAFDSSQREDNNLIVAYLVAQDGVSEEDARQALSAFVSDCYADFRAGKTVTIPDVGTLSFDEGQEITFEPVASSDFNGDAFGLEDLNPQPVYVSSVDVKDDTLGNNGNVPDDKKPRKRVWLWVLLCLLLLCGTFVALCYYKMIPVELPFFKKAEQTVVQDTTSQMKDTIQEIIEPLVVSDLVTDSVPPLDLDTIPGTITDTITDTIADAVADTLVMPVDTLVPVQDTVVKPVVTPPVEMKAFIVGGCFSIEENAMKMVDDVKEQGCSDAFVMKRGKMFYVCYGQYVTTADAKAALPDILKNYNKKAWILTK